MREPQIHARSVPGTRGSATKRLPGRNALSAASTWLARIHRDISERIRIIRRLDFTQPERIDATYDEHAQIPRNAMQRRLDQAGLLLRNHIEMSKAVVRQITVHRLHSARTSLSRDAVTQRRTA